jgi:hypothetical protein
LIERLALLTPSLRTVTLASYALRHTHAGFDAQASSLMPQQTRETRKLMQEKA